MEGRVHGQQWVAVTEVRDALKRTTRTDGESYTTAAGRRPAVGFEEVPNGSGVAGRDRNQVDDDDGHVCFEGRADLVRDLRCGTGIHLGGQRDDRRCF
jgi:hypothetical protein